MKDVATLYGQTVSDIAIQELGDAERAMEIAELNGLSISTELTPGLILQVPDYERNKIDVVQLFTNKALAPASMDVLSSDLDEGIDYWALELDFIVQ